MEEELKPLLCVVITQILEASSGLTTTPIGYLEPGEVNHQDGGLGAVCR